MKNKIKGVPLLGPPAGSRTVRVKLCGAHSCGDALPALLLPVCCAAELSAALSAPPTVRFVEQKQGSDQRIHGLIKFVGQSPCRWTVKGLHYGLQNGIAGGL